MTEKNKRVSVQLDNDNEDSTPVDHNPLINQEDTESVNETDEEENFKKL